LEATILWMNENLPVHFLDVGDEDKAVSTPTEKNVGQSWQQICADKKMRVQRFP